MYLSHFGLRDFPFRITPDPAFLYGTDDHHRALALLTRVAHGEQPVAIILGEPGTGKTILLQHFVASRPKDVLVGMITNYSSGLGGLDHWLHRAFDLHPEGSDHKLGPGFGAHFGARLAARHRQSLSLLLIVDEAQNLSDEDIAALTGLTELPDMSMGLVLVGQPRLRQSSYATQAWKEGGDSVLLQIGPMSSEDVSGYIRHRMAISGCRDAVFDDEAMERIARFAAGVPRLVNVLCEHLLISAFNADERKIDAALVEQVLQDVRPTGMLGHLLTFPARRGHGAAMATPGRATARMTAASSTPAEAGKPPPRAQVAEPAALRNPPGAEARPPPATLPALQDASPDTIVTPIRAEQTRNGRAGRVVIAAGTAAAVVALAVFSPSLMAPRSTVADMQQGDAADAQAPSPAAAPGNVGGDVGPALPTPTILQGSDATSLRNQALDVGAQAPLTAAIGFARAALRGDARAAYYLGQHLEVGDGVPRNAALAAAWYASASQTQRSARRALQNLTETQKATGPFPAAPPRPLMGVIGTDGVAEFVWVAPDDSATQYLVELAEDPDAPPHQYGPFELSAAILEPALPARIWRVVSLDDENARISASGWHLIASDEDDAIAAVPGSQAR